MTTETQTLWYIEFRVFTSLDYHRPLMDIPMQQTYVWAGTEFEAKNEVCSWDRKSDVLFYTVERAPEWMQKR